MAAGGEAGAAEGEDPMHNCPNCGLEAVGEEFCPDCGVKLARPAEGDAPREDRELRTRVVYQALDELSGRTVQKLLESEGIEAWLDSPPGGGFDGRAGFGRPFWGRVLVLEDREAAACRAIEGYLRSLGPGLH